MYEELMYKDLLEQGFMRDHPTEEVSWPWPQHLQQAPSCASSTEKVNCSEAML
jgi:hypothetical protein